MDASDMIDVLHFFFEEETAFISAEQAGELTRIRGRLYETLYETKYRYGRASSETKLKNRIHESTRNGNFAEDDDFSDLTPFDPARPPMEHKPFVPATEVGPDENDPFNGLLDAPLGH
jgi:hypothetical protein